MRGNPQAAFIVGSGGGWIKIEVIMYTPMLLNLCSRICVTQSPNWAMIVLCNE
jgi:hypothetical protein